MKFGSTSSQEHKIEIKIKITTTKNAKHKRKSVTFNQAVIIVIIAGARK